MSRLAAILGAAMRAEDPVAALREAAEDPSLDPALRDALRAVDPDGVRLQALLVARLRFERLLAACPEVGRELDEEPEAFSATFRAYHREVPMSAWFPGAEARLYRAWRASRS